MSGYPNVMAWQGAGMFGRPDEQKSSTRVRDVWLRTFEYRMLDMLKKSGFSDQEIRSILNAILPALSAGEDLTRPTLERRLQDNGIAPEVASIITSSVAAALPRR